MLSSWGSNESTTAWTIPSGLSGSTPPEDATMFAMAVIRQLLVRVIVPEAVAGKIPPSLALTVDIERVPEADAFTAAERLELPANEIVPEATMLTILSIVAVPEMDSVPEAVIDFAATPTADPVNLSSPELKELKAPAVRGNNIARCPLGYAEKIGLNVRSLFLRPPLIQLVESYPLTPEYLPGFWNMLLPLRTNTL